MTTPTPRTDAAESAMTAYNGHIDRVTATFARQLERELNETRWLLAIRDGRIEDARKMEREGLLP